MMGVWFILWHLVVRKPTTTTNMRNGKKCFLQGSEGKKEYRAQNKCVFVHV